MNLVFRLAWRNLWRHPRRTWLTTGAMVFSNILLVFLISLQFGMYGLMIDNSLQALSGHMQIQARGYVDDQKMRQVVKDITPMAERIRTRTGSRQIAARAQTFVFASSAERSYAIALLGVEPDFERNVSSIPGLIKEGRFLQPDATGEIVIGSVLARNLRVGLGDELTMVGSGLDSSFAATVVTVTGIFESGIKELDRSIAEIPLRDFQEVFFMEGAGHQIVINASHIDDAPALLSRIERMLTAHEDLVVHDWNRLQPGLRQAIQADMTSAFFMYGVLAVLVALSVLNTQLMSVLERTHEFGITLSLGLKPGRLARLVLLETALMGVLGLILGALAGALVTEYFGVYGFQVPGMEEMSARFNLPARMHPQITPFTLLLGPCIVFLFTIMAAVYPALRLYWLQPVAAMRAL